MIERDFIKQKTKEYYIKAYVEQELKGAGISEIKLKKIPLGEKIIVSASRPSIIIGSKGGNIRELTKTLKRKFKLENPQIEINEVKNIFLDASVVAQRIANSLERFGSARFKGVGHKTMENVLTAGALGVEIIISGKIPGARAKNWRFYQGYLKKCGDVSIVGVRSAQTHALLKSGIIGIKVSIMPPNLVLPDSIEILDEPITIVEEEDEAPKKGKKASKTTKKTSKKKESKKKSTKKVAKETTKEEAPAEEAVVEEKQVEEVAKEEPVKAETTAEEPVAEVKESEKDESPNEDQKEVTESKEDTENNEEKESSEEKPNPEEEKK